MKKILAIVLAVFMVVSLAACNNNENPPETTNPSQDITPTTPDNGEVPVLSTHENLMISVVGKIEMPYPVMTWAIDVKNPEQVAYYMDADASKMDSITLTETAYDMDPTLTNNIFSVMYIKAASADVAEAVAQDVLDGLKFDRWNGQTAEDVYIEHAVVGDCIVIILLDKDETAYTIADLLAAFKAGLEGAEINLKPEITPPTTPAEGAEGNGEATVVPDDSTDNTDTPAEPTDEPTSAESTAPAEN